MQHMKMVTIPAREAYTKMVEDYVSCDFCNCAIMDRGRFEVEGVSVRHEYGKSFPDGGWANETWFDVCPSCFMNKLIPWAKSLGAEPTIRERNW